MSAARRLHEVLRRARVRRGLDVALRCLPWCAIASCSPALADRWSPGRGRVALIGVVALARHRMHRLDTRWLVRELDARRPDLEDSTDLLFAPRASLTALERLQVARVQQRIEATAAPDLRPRWSKGRHRRGRARRRAGDRGDPGVAARQAGHLRQRLANIGVRVGHADAHARGATTCASCRRRTRACRRARTTTLDAKAPQGTRLQWTLRFAPQPGGRSWSSTTVAALRSCATARTGARTRS
jgi:hypothetical protein